jgi:hypothetical protein
LRELFHGSFTVFTAHNAICTHRIRRLRQWLTEGHGRRWAKCESLQLNIPIIPSMSDYVKPHVASIYLELGTWPDGDLKTSDFWCFLYREVGHDIHDEARGITRELFLDLR